MEEKDLSKQIPISPAKILLVLGITIGMVFLVLFIMRLRNRRIMEAALKERSKKKKAETVYEEVSVSQSETIEMK